MQTCSLQVSRYGDRGKLVSLQLHFSSQNVKNWGDEMYAQQMDSKSPTLRQYTTAIMEKKKTLVHAQWPHAFPRICRSAAVVHRWGLRFPTVVLSMAFA